MKWLILIVALTALLHVSAAEGDVVVLTDENFDEYIQKSPIIMVKFHAPWCGHCKAFAPEYEKAAKMAKEQGKSYVIADLEATENKKAADKNQIQGFPTVKLFINGKPIDYNGDRTAEAVIGFIDKKTQPPSTKLEDAESAKKVKEGKGLRCILASEDPNMLKSYTEIAGDMEDYAFYHANLDTVKAAFPEAANNNVVLLKDFDEGVAIFTESLDKLRDFLREHSLPVVSELNQKVIDVVIRDRSRKGIWLFRSASAPNVKEIDEMYQKIALQLKSKEWIFVKSDIKEGWGQRSSEFFGITEDMLPVLEAIEMKEDMLRFRHSGAFNEKEVKEFIENWKNGKIPRYLKSEEVPAENSGPVFKLVGKSFKQEILDNDDDVMIKFYAPWCGHCKKLEPIYKSIAESLKGNKKLKLFEMDGTKNDVEGVSIQGFPTIVFYPGKSKDSYETFNGDRTEEGIARYLKEKCSNPIDVPDLKSKDERDASADDL